MADAALGEISDMLVEAEALVVANSGDTLSDEGRRRLRAHLAHELAMHDWLLNASENKGPAFRRMESR